MLWPRPLFKVANCDLESSASWAVSWKWLILHRQKVPDGSATAKTINYSLNRWEALTRYLDDGNLPIDNNWVENRIRPVAQGRASWLFSGSLRAGRRAAVIMS